MVGSLDFLRGVWSRLSSGRSQAVVVGDDDVVSVIPDDGDIGGGVVFEGRDLS